MQTYSPVTTAFDNEADALQAGFAAWCNGETDEFSIFTHTFTDKSILVTWRPNPPTVPPNYENTAEAQLTRISCLEWQADSFEVPCLSPVQARVQLVESIMDAIYGSPLEQASGMFDKQPIS